MGEPLNRRATYEDLLAAPANVSAEIIDGVLITTRARPHFTRARVFASRHGVR